MHNSYGVFSFTNTPLENESSAAHSAKTIVPDQRNQLVVGPEQTKTHEDLNSAFKAVNECFMNKEFSDINLVSAEEFEIIMQHRLDNLKKFIPDLNPEKFLEMYTAQGQGFSVNHKISVPALEDMVNNASKAMGGLASNLNFGGIGMESFRLWLFLTFTLTFIIEIFPPSDDRYIKHIRATRYVTLSVLIIFCLLAPDESDPDKKMYLMKIKEFIWEHIFPLWQKENGDLDTSSDEEIEMDNVYFAQSFGEHVPTISAFLAGLLSLLIGFKVKKHLIDSLTSLTKISATQVTNITAFIVVISGGIAKLFEKLELPELSKYFDIQVCDSNAVSAFVLKSTTFVNKITAGDIYSSAFHSEVYIELIRDGEELVRTVEKNSYDARIVSEMLKKLRDCSDKVDVIRRSLNGTRIEPVGVLITGDPGVFKGVLSERLTTLVGSHTIPSEWKEEYDADPKQFHFAIPNDRFFDRYNYKKWIATADDVFQIRDTVGDPDSEAVRIIKMINSAEYVLPMSSVTEKNSMFFRSAFLFGTSNMKEIKVASVNSSQAVTRRFNIQIDVEVAPKYRNVKGKTNYKKLPTLLDYDEEVEPLLGNSTVIPNEFWRLTVTKRSGDKEEILNNLTIEDVAVMIISAHHDRIKNYYVNKLMNTQQQALLHNNILNRLPIMNLYSKMALDTFTAQSGMPGAFGGDKGYVEGRWRFQQFFHDLGVGERNVYMEAYFMMLGRKVYIDLFNEGASGLKNFFTTITDSETKLFESHIGQHEEFVELVGAFYEDRMRRGIHPITNIPFKTPTDPRSILRKIKNTLKPATDYIYENRVLITIGGVFLMGGIFFLSGFFKSTIGNAFKSQSVDLSKDRAKVGKSIKLHSKLNTITLRPQSAVMGPISKDILPKIDTSVLGHKSNTNDVSVQIMNKYLFIVYIVRPDGDSLDIIRLGHAWNLKGNVFMMPFHFMYKLHDVHKQEEYLGATMLFTTATKSTKYTCSIEDVIRSFKCSEDSANNDCCVFQIASAHKTSVGMMRHIAKLDDLKRLKRINNFKATITGTYLGKEQKSNSLRILKTNSHFKDAVGVVSNWQGETHMYKLEDVLEYDGDFGSGDCGSFVTIDGNDFENRTVFGMHVAGEYKDGKGFGISSVIVQEYLQLLIDDSYKNYHIFDDEEDCPRLENIGYVSQSGLVPIAKLDPWNSTGDVCTSSLTKSALFGKLPEPFRKVTHFPAKLIPFEDKKTGIIIDPGIRALNKYEQEPIHFEEGLVRKAVASYENLINSYMLPTKELRRTVSIKEALHSFHSVKGINPSTSPGFPMNLPVEENIKKKYYKAVEDGDLEKENLYYERIAKLVRNKEECYSKGIRPATFYKGVLKDELRPLKKVTEGSTRYFSAYDFIMLVLFRMYFGGFMSAFIDANAKVGSAIGINCYSRDWDKIARNLLKFSDKKTDSKIGAGDYSGFDTCHKVEIQDAIVEMINRWYGKDNPDNHIRLKLWADITNSKQIYRNHVYEWFNGMPSGNPLTSLINTIYNNILFRMCYILAGFDFSTFNSKVYVICMGDDNVFTVSDDVADEFNELKLVDLMSKCGMKYTTEFKDAAVVPFRMITDVEFLKRKFRFDHSCNRWVAPMRLEAVFATLNWTQKGVEGDQICADKVSGAVSEISLHGRNVFNQLIPPLLGTLYENLPYVQPHKEIYIDYDIVYSEVLKTEFMY